MLRLFSINEEKAGNAVFLLGPVKQLFSLTSYSNNIKFTVDIDGNLTGFAYDSGALKIKTDAGLSRVESSFLWQMLGRKSLQFDGSALSALEIKAKKAFINYYLKPDGELYKNKAEESRIYDLRSLVSFDKESKIREVRQKIEADASELEKVSGEITDLSIKIDFKSESEKLRTRLKTSKDKSAEIKNKIDALKKRLPNVESLSQRLELLDKKIESASELRIGIVSAINDLKKAEGEQKSFLSDIEKYSAELESLSSEDRFENIKELKKYYFELKGDIESAKNESNEKIPKIDASPVHFNIGFISVAFGVLSVILFFVLKDQLFLGIGAILLISSFLYLKPKDSKTEKRLTKTIGSIKLTELQNKLSQLVKSNGFLEEEQLKKAVERDYTVEDAKKEFLQDAIKKLTPELNRAEVELGVAKKAAEKILIGTKHESLQSYLSVVDDYLSAEKEAKRFDQTVEDGEIKVSGFAKASDELNTLEKQIESDSEYLTKGASFNFSDDEISRFILDKDTLEAKKKRLEKMLQENRKKVSDTENETYETLTKKITVLQNEGALIASSLKPKIDAYWFLRSLKSDNDQDGDRSAIDTDLTLVNIDESKDLKKIVMALSSSQTAQVVFFAEKQTELLEKLATRFSSSVIKLNEEFSFSGNFNWDKAYNETETEATDLDDASY